MVGWEDGWEGGRRSEWEGGRRIDGRVGGKDGWEDGRVGWEDGWESRFANNALLGGGVRQRKIKRRSKALLSFSWQSWTSLSGRVGGVSGSESGRGNGIWKED